MKSQILRNQKHLNAREEDRRNRLLLRAASSFASARHLKDLLEATSRGLEPMPGAHLAGVGIHEARRRILIVYTLPVDARLLSRDHAPLSADGEEFSLRDSEASRFLTKAEVYESPDLHADQLLPVHKRFHQAGIRRYISVPLFYGDQLLGALYTFSYDDLTVSAEDVEYLRQLGLLITPALWSYLIQDRLAKGDRRRGILIELSGAINTSLKFKPVLQAARQAIGQIEGHRLSIIGLLEEDPRFFRAYWHPRKLPDQSPSEQSEILSVKSTALSWVLKHRKTYESDDLSRPHFDMDVSLRNAGVRRYVVAPLFVRGRIIGGFFFGTTDPHPALTTDVWLYENIALQLALAIDNARQFEQLQRLSDRLAQQNVYLREEIDTHHNIEEMIGQSRVMQRVFDQIARVANTDATVLIAGPTGVGKELVARAIHARSERADQPLVKVNCAAIAESLVESELFGHERGAFTSAVSRRIGRFELARDGTLFLDEVGELPLTLQSKLLRVLQDGEFERVGGTETITTNARIIAATNRDLLKAVENGAFRSDLYYRLNVFPIDVPPLSERREDIPMLVESFVAQFRRSMGKNIESIDPDSLDYLCQRDWPGNIRELRHVIERAMILCDGPRLIIEATAAGPRPSPPSTAGASEELSPSKDTVHTLEDMERQHICRVLEQTGGVIDGARGAATLLGLKPSTLRSRMKRLGISRN